ncbi:hypothetical protein MRN18_17115 [bacterium 19MO04SH03]|uniref:Uncharacterized protein n=1 Tax=bacterium 19MO04SH03 TaxID=2920644 RepID=A0AAU6V149_UNCXX
MVTVLCGNLVVALSAP